MKVESLKTGKQSEWVDPIFSVYHDEFDSLVGDLEKGLGAIREGVDLTRRQESSFLLLCEHLCEGSREVVFAVDRISICNAERLRSLFSRAVKAMHKVRVQNLDEQDRVISYRTHVEIRLENLKEWIDSAE